MGTKKAARRAEPAESESKYERAMRKVKATAPRDPLFPEPGSYDCTFLGLEIPEPEPGQLEWCRVSFDHEGTTYNQLHCMSGKSLGMSLGRLKGLCMAIVGTTDESEYDDWDPKSKFLSALQGFSNKFSEDAEAYKGNAQVRVIVTKGGETSDGTDWYRNATYAVCGEAEAEETDDEDEPESEPAPKGKKGKRS
jgi:hypothetical protein